MSELDERRLHDGRGNAAATDVDLHRRSFLDLGREERERDPLLEHRREVSARHLARGFAGDEHRAPFARHLASIYDETAQAARDAAFLLGEQRVASAEVTLVEAGNPTQTCLERRDVRTELVAVQWQACLEPQRVARAETGRLRP